MTEPLPDARTSVTVAPYSLGTHAEFPVVATAEGPGPTGVV
jgi:hypothetical protein